MDTNKPIGVFDSGVGGLTVLKRLIETLPDEDYIYFGDTARIPYGEKTPDQIIQFVREILNWYKSNNVKAVLMACNSSSAVALNVVKDEYDFPVFGLIEPASKYVAGLSEKKIGLIATSATAKSGAYRKNIMELAPDKEVYEIGCPGLVELIESGKFNTEEAKAKVNEYISMLLENGAEKIILGCTHYPFLRNVINQITNKPDMLIDPAEFLVEIAKSRLEKLNLLKKSGTGTRKYYVSSNPTKFAEVGNMFCPDCTQVEEINLSFINV